MKHRDVTAAEVYAESAARASRLSPEHRAQLHASGLTDETSELAGIRSEDDAEALKNLLGWADSKPWRGNSCMVIPYPGDDGFVRVRPDKPVARRGGSKPKYEQPVGVSVRLYFAPRGLADGRLRDAGQPLYFVEGEKKALLLDQLGYAVVGAPGVTCFGDTDRKKSRGKWEGKPSADVLHPSIREHAVIARRDIFILFDADAATNPDVARAERKLRKLLVAAGAGPHRVRVLRLPTDGPKGIDDVFVALRGEHGQEAAEDMLRGFLTLRDMLPQTSSAEEAVMRDPVASVGEAVCTSPKTGNAARSAVDQSGRPTIVPLEAERRRVVDAALACLASASNLFTRDGFIVRVQGAEAGNRTRNPQITRDANAPTIARVQLHTLLEVLSDVAAWELPDGDGWRSVGPPKWVAETILARGEWRLPPLHGLITTPQLLRDGRILTAPGYDSASGLYYVPDGLLITVAERPTRADAQAALELLLDVIRDFPFVAPEHRATWLCAVLTLLALFAFDGPIPLFLFDASAKGSGKTLVAVLAALISTGRSPAMLAQASGEEERKRLTSIAMAGDPVALIDNVTGQLGNDALCIALTSPDRTWNDRALGSNTMYRGSLNTAFMVSSNNCTLGPDMDRRVSVGRLEPKVEDAAARTDFRHPDIMAHVKAVRAELVSAALTILRAYQVAGRPQVDLLPLGSFEAWTRTVRAAAVWAGAADPERARADFVRTADGERDTIRDLLVALAHFGRTHGESFMASDVVEHVGAFPDSDLAAAVREQADGARVSSRSVGKMLAKVRGRIVGGLRLGAIGAGKKAIAWHIEDVSGGLAGVWGFAGGFEQSKPPSAIPHDSEDESGVAGVSGFVPDISNTHAHAHTRAPESDRFQTPGTPKPPELGEPPQPERWVSATARDLERKGSSAEAARATARSMYASRWPDAERQSA